jgi:hypothetical protein
LGLGHADGRKRTCGGARVHRGPRSVRALVSFAALFVLAQETACAPAAAPSPDATHRPVASITGIINCGYPESVARLGLTWTTHYLPGDAPGEGAGALSLPRARVEITNRSGVPHVVRFARSVPLLD